MNLSFSSATNKKQVFDSVTEFLKTEGFNVIDSDDCRPWGGFFVIDESQSNKFISRFFEEAMEPDSSMEGKVSPKILVVEGNKRLSWQYHHRRKEKWVVIGGTVGVITSDTDKEGVLQIKKISDVIKLRQGERHRLIGLESWGIVAEIWQHTDQNNPSDEQDIVRVQDDFGR